MRGRGRRVWSVGRRLLGALVVGVATLFQPKADPRRHWSIPPTFPLEEQTPGQADREPLP